MDYGARDRGQMMLRFVEERPVSDVTCAFLEWVCQVKRTLREAGTGFSVGQCHMAYLTEGALLGFGRTMRLAKRTGGLRLLVCRLPVKSPWLNPIEPKWVLALRAIVEPAHKLSVQELKTRICDYFKCSLLEPLAKHVS